METQLIECVSARDGRTVFLPPDLAAEFARAGAVRIQVRPDERYAKPTPLPIRATWTGGFSPGKPVTR